MNELPLVRVLPVASRLTPADRVAALFDEHHGRLYRLARRLTGNVDDALDLVQETFLKAARSPSSVPMGARHEEAWLVRVLINIRRDQWRRAAVRTRYLEGMRRSARVTDGQDARLIARATVWRALDALTPRRRAVIVLHELEGLTPSAIASLLGISAVTVRWHLSRGRRELARVIRPQPGESHEDR